MLKARAQEALLGTHRVSSSISGPQQLEQLRRVVEEELPELIEKLRETTDM